MQSPPQTPDIQDPAFLAFLARMPADMFPPEIWMMIAASDMLAMKKLSYVSRSFYKRTKEEREWRSLVENDLTEQPRLRQGETYAEYYKDIFSSLSPTLNDFYRGLLNQNTPPDVKIKINLLKESVKLGLEKLVKAIVESLPLSEKKVVVFPFHSLQHIIPKNDFNELLSLQAKHSLSNSALSTILTNMIMSSTLPRFKKESLYIFGCLSFVSTATFNHHIADEKLIAPLWGQLSNATRKRIFGLAADYVNELANSLMEIPPELHNDLKHAITLIAFCGKFDNAKFIIDVLPEEKQNDYLIIALYTCYFYLMRHNLNVANAIKLMLAALPNKERIEFIKQSFLITHFAFTDGLDQIDPNALPNLVRSIIINCLLDDDDTREYILARAIYGMMLFGSDDLLIESMRSLQTINEEKLFNLISTACKYGILGNVSESKLLILLRPLNAQRKGFVLIDNLDHLLTINTPSQQVISLINITLQLNLLPVTLDIVLRNSILPSSDLGTDGKLPQELKANNILKLTRLLPNLPWQELFINFINSLIDKARYKAGYKVRYSKPSNELFNFIYFFNDAQINSALKSIMMDLINSKELTRLAFLLYSLPTNGNSQHLVIECWHEIIRQGKASEYVATFNKYFEGASGEFLYAMSRYDIENNSNTLSALLEKTDYSDQIIAEALQATPSYSDELHLLRKLIRPEQFFNAVRKIIEVNKDNTNKEFIERVKYLFFLLDEDEQEKLIYKFYLQRFFSNIVNVSKLPFEKQSDEFKQPDLALIKLTKELSDYVINACIEYQNDSSPEKNHFYLITDFVMDMLNKLNDPALDYDLHVNNREMYHITAMKVIMIGLMDYPKIDKHFLSYVKGFISHFKISDDEIMNLKRDYENSVDFIIGNNLQKLTRHNHDVTQDELMLMLFGEYSTNNPNQAPTRKL